MPGMPVYVSSTTLAGRAMAEQKLAALVEGVFYAPIDYRFAVRRVLRTLRPAVLVVMETEIWPNLYREARLAGARLIVVNGRISDRAIASYRRWRWFFRPVLAWADLMLAQSETDRERYLAVGAPADRVMLAGNLKYDFDPSHAAPPAAVRELIDRVRPLEIWIAASTMPPAEPGDPDEDDVVIAAFRQLASRRPGLLLVLVPRKPERFDSAASKLAAGGVPFTRRSAIGDLTLPGVLLVDSMGELSALFELADVVFMGGTLAHRGGHNILEPAFAARAVIAGPHMENFSAIAREFSEGDALVPIGGAEELAASVEALLDDPARRAEIGERARRLAEAKRGATARAVQEIAKLYQRAMPSPRRPLPVRIALSPLSWIWSVGSRIHRAISRSVRLGVPVISVGNVTMGGTGKTPLVLWLAHRLPGSAILTRGYRRQSSEPLVLSPGASAPSAVTGDEPQIYLRAGVATVGIGADRTAVAARVERECKPARFLLDDGFQHWRLARDFDIVVIDALDPWGGGAVFPLGKLREPLTALARAGAFVLSRADRPMPAIEEVLRRYNPGAPIFYSRVVPEAWIPAPPRGAKAAGFCGIANPDSFWRTCSAMGVNLEARHQFPDHHRYTAEELERIAQGVDVLLTTEKDFYNLPESRPAVPVCYLRIGVEVNNGDELIRLVEASSSSR